jgi:hypothetical protein
VNLCEMNLGPTKRVHSASSLLEGAPGMIAIVIGALTVFYQAYKMDRPMLIAAAGLAPLAVVFAWSRPFVICSLCIAFSYFRLHEAYLFLEPLKPILLLGTASVALFASKVLLSPDRDARDTRLLRPTCRAARDRFDYI